MKFTPLVLVFALFVFGSAPASAQGLKWVASWTTPISKTLKRDNPPAGLSPDALVILKSRPDMRQSEFDFALPKGEASDQSFRMIVKPDLWGNTVRMRFSNLYGDRALSIAAASVGLQDSGGCLLPGTAVRMTFGGQAGVSIPTGAEVFSDPVHLSFVTDASKPWLHGRNLSVSFEVGGQSGPLSIHGAPVISYIARPNSGDQTMDESGAAFPYTTHSFYLVSELDVMADPGTAVVCALGDSITDGGKTVNGYDGWSDDLSRRLHLAYGDRISVVNMGIGGNMVVTDLGWPTNEPAVKRLDRDVLGISGLTSVVWLEGINDLGGGQNKPGPVIEGYKQIVGRLHARGIIVVGATVTPSLWLEPLSESPPSMVGFHTKYGSLQTNAYRKQLNEFIRNSGIYDSVADMSKATEDPATGALYESYQDGDYLHPNRIGHEAMAETVDLNILAPGRK